MLSWLKRLMKSDVANYNELIEKLLLCQLTPKFKRVYDSFGALMKDQFAAGYVFGFHDCLGQRMGLYDPKNPGRLFMIIEKSYKSLFGEQAGFILFNQSVSSQNEEEFSNGRLKGGKEIDEYFLNKAQPKGLGAILFYAKSPKDSNIPTPLIKLEKIVKDWPKEQAKNAIMAVSSVIDGKDDFEKYLKKLTLDQFKVVVEIIHEIMAHS